MQCWMGNLLLVATRGMSNSIAGRFDSSTVRTSYGLPCCTSCHTDCGSPSIGSVPASPPGYEDPAAVLQLVEGGQLVLYHLGERQPLMVGPAFQQRTGISVADTAMVPVRRCGGRWLRGKGGELRHGQGGVWFSPRGQATANVSQRPVPSRCAVGAHIACADAVG